MKLTFVGTRGYIEESTSLHAMHTAMLVTQGATRVLVDCGETWLGKFEALKPRAIVLTHAHPDHAAGLQSGTKLPVYASRESWEVIKEYPIAKREVFAAEKEFKIGGITFIAFEVDHSTTCPAVGLRISAGNRAVFYSPDLVYIHNREAALGGVDIYIGDGATVTTSFVRRRGATLIGHSPIGTQLTWCKKESVPTKLPI